MNVHPVCRSVVCAVMSLAACCAVTVSQEMKPPDKWVSMQFLLGQWEGEGGGTPGQGAGGTTFEYDLQKTVLVRKNFAEFPATADRPVSRHDDLMVVYMENGKPWAMYFDNEEHVIRYAVTATTDTVTFVSDASAGSPRFRLTYTKKSADALTLLFEIAPPNAPEKFSRYIEASIRRKK